jgi:hypothetical protein
MSFTFSDLDGWFKEGLKLCCVLLLFCGFTFVTDLGEIVGAASAGVTEEEALLVGDGDGRRGVAYLRVFYELGGLNVLGRG